MMKKISRRSFLFGMGAMGAAAALAGCGAASSASVSAAASSAAASGTGTASGALALDMAAWQYDADNDVYYQIGAAYCTAPAAADYETMGIYVPGAYFTGTANSDGTYTCTVNGSGAAGGYTASTAPFVLPVNTAGYAAQPAPTSYSYDGLSSYLEAGLIYVYAGCRGRANGYDSTGALTYSGGAPWGVTDLKAAVRCLRYNAVNLPGDTDRIFTFGHSGGGAQSSLVGASGDSELYTPYLESIGAAMTGPDGAALSDATFGAMCWCPITALDVADEAYEWMMGQYADTDTRADGTFTAALSQDLAKAFAEELNGMGLTAADGTALALSESTDGVYRAGSYCDYLKTVIETSLNHFLADNTFPYTSGGTTMADGGFAGGASGGMGGGRPSGSMPSGSAPSGAADGTAGATAASGSAASGAADGTTGATASSGAAASGAGMTAMGGSTESVTYDTVQAYIDALNESETWVAYDAASNTASVTDIGAFVRNCKTPTKSVGAFDALDRSQAENDLFGNDDSDALHFDTTMAQLLTDNADTYAALSGWSESYPTDYTGDLALQDALGSDRDTRMNMYNPMYYVCGSYAGAGSSTVAPHWRIRTGIDQGDTALTTEVNLSLALAQNSAVSDVDFETVWGLGHTTAERTGDSTTNFISWVADCCG